MYFRWERFPTGTYGKQSKRMYGPYRILNVLTSSAYLIKLPEDMPTSLVFDVSEIFQYHGEPPTTGDVLFFLLQMLVRAMRTRLRML